MTPKEKAEELINRYNSVNKATGSFITNFQIKQCVLIAVNEIINSEPSYPSDVDWDDCGGTHQYYYEEQREEAKKYWNEVKEEIEKL